MTSPRDVPACNGRFADEPTRRLAGDDPTKWNGLLFFIAACLIQDFLVFPFLRELSIGFRPRVIIPAILLGDVAGQIAFAGVFAGMICKRWLDGYLIGLLLTWGGITAFAASILLNEPYATVSDFAGLYFAAPGLLFLLASPLYLCRNFYQWRLVRSGMRTSPPQSGLVDIFVTTVLAAAVVSLARAPMIIWEIPFAEYLPVVSILAGVFLVCGWLVCVPAVQWGLRESGETPPLIAFFWMGFSWFLVAATVTVVLSLAMGQQIFAELFLLWGLSISLATAILAAGTILMRAVGFRLNRRAADHPDVDPGALPRARIRGQKWQVAVILLVAVGVSLGLGALQGWRRGFDGRMMEASRQADDLGGHVTYSNRRLDKIALHRVDDVTFSSFMRNLECDTVSNLDLSGSTIGDDSLQVIGDCTRLSYLDVSETKVAGLKFGALSSLPVLESLNLSGLDLRQADWEGLPNRNLCVLILQRANLPDDFGDRLSRLASLDVLDLSGTNVDGSVLLALGQVRRLSLADTDLFGDDLVPLQRLNQIHALDLSNTPLTDRCMAEQISGLVSLLDLNLEGTGITDQSVSSLNHLVMLERLNIAGTGIRGSSLLGGLPPALRDLTVSEGQVSETEVKSLEGRGIEVSQAPDPEEYGRSDFSR